MSKPELNKKVQEISKFPTPLHFVILIFLLNLETLLTKAGLSSKIDDSGQSVGKRYARTDENGIPYAFTVDYDTLEDNTITMRELDTMK